MVKRRPTRGQQTFQNSSGSYRAALKRKRKHITRQLRPPVKKRVCATPDEVDNAVKEAWSIKRSPEANLKAIGLCGNVNEHLRLKKKVADSQANTEESVS